MSSDSAQAAKFKTIEDRTLPFNDDGFDLFYFDNGYIGDRSQI